MRNKNSSFALLPFYLERIRFSDRILPVLAIPENYDMERYRTGARPGNARTHTHDTCVRRRRRRRGA